MTAVKDTHEPELVEKDGHVYYLSDDGLGHQVAWDRCHGNSGGCGQSIMRCNCKGGPKEPYYITRWRCEALGIDFRMPGRKPISLVSQRTLASRNVPGTSTKISTSPSVALTDFIDTDVIARVKAASETPEDQR